MKLISKSIVVFLTALVLISATNVSYINSSKFVGDLKVGDKAPELVFNDPEGNPIALSSLKGKIVLIDFWASWCMPCRMENPNVVRIYQKYKDSKFKNANGFTVYSVSLDHAKGAWLKAIEKDKLEWKNHVSDFVGWGSEAANVYKVIKLPSTFLIDNEGTILAKDLKGEELDKQLTALLAE